MKTKINISIPEPCHENWQKMSPTEKGRFCDSCQKNVFDFTKASDRQIIEAYKQNQNLCGRFLNTQLDRDLVAPKEKSSVWLATTSAVLSFLALGTNESFAQGEPRIEQTDKKTVFNNAVIENDSIEEKTITGIVTDVSGPLPSVNVFIKGNESGVSTNFDGTYSIKVKEGETLVFSFMGLENVEITIGSNDIYNITMKEDPRNNSSVIVTAGFGVLKSSHTKKHYWRNSEHDIEGHTFFGRIFHRIGNWFK